MASARAAERRPVRRPAAAPIELIHRRSRTEVDLAAAQRRAIGGLVARPAEDGGRRQSSRCRRPTSSSIEALDQPALDEQRVGELAEARRCAPRTRSSRRSIRLLVRGAQPAEARPGGVPARPARSRLDQEAGVATRPRTRDRREAGATPRWPPFRLLLAACGGGGGGGGRCPGRRAGARHLLRHRAEPTPAGAVGASEPLARTTFGADFEAIDSVAREGAEAWFDRQLALPPSLHEPIVRRYLAEYGFDINANPPPGTFRRFAFWETGAHRADQLRQVVATPDADLRGLGQRRRAVHQPAGAVELLRPAADPRLRQLPRAAAAVNLHPAMGVYPSHVNNARANPVANTFPDENYAREVMQPSPSACSS
ncbi:MAG: DUF1800 family protein [bacterium]